MCSDGSLYCDFIDVGGYRYMNLRSGYEMGINNILQSFALNRRYEICYGKPLWKVDYRFEDSINSSGRLNGPVQQ